MTYNSVDSYIASFPSAQCSTLQALRSLVHSVFPGVTEEMRHEMPTFVADGVVVVCFAGWKNDITLHPVPRMTSTLVEHALEPYRSGDTLVLPMKNPLPCALIRKVVIAMAHAHHVKMRELEQAATHVPEQAAEVAFVKTTSEDFPHTYLVSA